MDAFDDNLQVFNSTIYGSEMKDALYRCFELIRVEIDYYSSMLAEIESKISMAEGGN